ncbi:MAG: acetyl-CoA carboxylase biotin carboxyl carrier protein [Planctomycetaceae bacterium]
MAKSQATSASGSFDLDRLKKLLQMMEKHGVTEVNLESSDERWKVRRGPKEVLAPGQMMAAAPAAAPVVAAAPAVAAAAPAGEAAPAEASAPSGVTINSPTVGTFYLSPTPEDPTFVNIGDQVGPETVVCIVEAMKVFNQIPAEVSGKIVEVLVNNGDAVEFGQPLFRVEP